MWLRYLFRTLANKLEVVFIALWQYFNMVVNRQSLTYTLGTSPLLLLFKLRRLFVISSCCNITCELVPGSPPPFLFIVRARGEPGNEAKVLYSERHLLVGHSQT